MDSDDRKITQLTRVTSLSDSDLFVVSINVGTTPVTRAIKKSDAITGSGSVVSIVAGTGITVDDTDPANPIVSATSTGGADENAVTSLIMAFG